MWAVGFRGTSEDCVGRRLDLYCINCTGAAPETFLRYVADRVSPVHLKDMPPDDPLSDLPVGEGTLPWDTLLETADAAGVEWYIAEQDNPRDALEDVTISLRHLRGFGSA